MNINFEAIKKYIEDNRSKVKIYAAIAIVLLSLLYYKTSIGAGDIQVSTMMPDDNAIKAGETEENISQQAGANTAVSYHSTEAYVDISGEVRKPGVYKVTTSTRLFEVIELAGGLTENANYNSLNQAEMVYDGEKVIVPHVDADRIYEVGKSSTTTAYEPAARASGQEESELININTADAALLQTLPGIGPVKSQSIVDYRNANGSFSSIDELKKVTGIGKKTFETIKELITA